METTFRNHKRLQDLFFDKEDESGRIFCYWDYYVNGSKDMYCIFDKLFLSHFERTSYDIDDNPYVSYEIPNLFFENLLSIFSLEEIEGFGFNTQTIDGITLVQYNDNTIENELFNKRVLKNLSHGNENSIIHTHPHFHSQESDYDTLIEIVTTFAYKICSFNCSLINNDFIAVTEEDSEYFFKSEKHYDMKSYGTHWM